MKKIVVLLFISMVLVSSVAFGQQTSFAGEAQYVHSASTDAGNYPYSWASYSHANKEGLGYFVETTVQSGFQNLALGVFTAATIHGGTWYLESALGPGVDLAEGKLEISANAWVYFETAANRPEAAGKLIVSTSLYNSQEFGLWSMSYIVAYVTKKLAFGVHAQSDALAGARVQYNLPKGFVLEGMANRQSFIVGISFSCKK